MLYSINSPLVNPLDYLSLGFIGLVVIQNIPSDSLEVEFFPLAFD